MLSYTKSALDLLWVCGSPSETLGDGRDDDPHMWVTPIDITQVLLHLCNKMNTPDLSRVISAILDEGHLRLFFLVRPERKTGGRHTIPVHPSQITSSGY